MTRRRRWLTPTLLVLALAATATAATTLTPGRSSAAALSLQARWSDADSGPVLTAGPVGGPSGNPSASPTGSAVPAGSTSPSDISSPEVVVDVEGYVDLTAPDLTVDLTGLEVRGIPDACIASGTTSRRSYITADGTRLVCELDPRTPATRLVVPTRDRPGGGAVTGTVTVGDLRTELPPRSLPTAHGAQPRLLRLVSSPDFLNADIGDLHQGPNRWTRRRSSNATNNHYETALGHVLDDWQSLDPDEVLVAGDLVEGHWDQDQHHTGTFGPVRTDGQRRQAIRRAARTFYPQWLARFASRGLDVRPALGDHEVGDNPWNGRSRRLVRTYKSEFARQFTRDQGQPRYVDHPTGRARGTAYAWRPVPQVQMVSVDVLDITRRHVHIRPDNAQLRWLEGVLARAQADGVTWTIVQAHTPVLEPVRAEGSSELHVPHRDDSAMWQLFERYGVDLYLAGEVHDTTLATAGGVTQLTHGGLFQYGLTTYALLDVYADHLEVDLRDYDTVVRRHGRRLWETTRPGSPRYVEVGATPFTIGTATLDPTAGLTSRTGILTPYS